MIIIIFIIITIIILYLYVVGYHCYLAGYTQAAGRDSRARAPGTPGDEESHLCPIEMHRFPL